MPSILKSEIRGEPALQLSVSEDQSKDLMSAFDPAKNREENAPKPGIEQYQLKDKDVDIEEYLEDDVNAGQKGKSRKKAEVITGGIVPAKAVTEAALPSDSLSEAAATEAESMAVSDSEHTTSSGGSFYIRPHGKHGKTSEHRTERRMDKMVEEVAAKTAAKVIAKASKDKEKEVMKAKLKEKPIHLKDAVGRKFVFPYHLVKTWSGMEDLIRQAFLHVEVLGPHVAEGHYDLVGPNGEIILPQVWETMVEPDWSVTMNMWPLPEAPTVPLDGVTITNAATPGHRPVSGRKPVPTSQTPRGRRGPPPPPPPGFMRPPFQHVPDTVDPEVAIAVEENSVKPLTKKKSKSSNAVLGGLFGDINPSAKSNRPADGKVLAGSQLPDKKEPAINQETEAPLLQWTGGKSTTFRQSKDSERFSHTQPPPRPRPGLEDDGEVDNSYQVAQSMMLEKTYQAFDFRVLMLWDLLRLQRQISDKLHSFREGPEDDENEVDFYDALSDYRLALRDWLAIQQFPRSGREDVKVFERHLENNLSQEEYEKLRSVGLWEGNVINLQINENKASGKIRKFLQMILPMRMVTTSDEAQFEEHLSALTLGITPKVKPKDVETESDQDRANVLSHVRKHHCSPIVDSIARLIVSISGGLLLVVPMIVLVKVNGLDLRMGVVVLSVFLFAIAVSQLSNGTSQELIGAVAAYAAVLTVFFGQIG